MINSLKAINLLVLFLVELAVLVAVTRWAIDQSGNLIVQLVAGVGVFMVFVLLWWRFGAQKARKRLTGKRRLTFESLWFGAGALALWQTGHVVFALALTDVFAISKAFAAWSSTATA